MRQDPHHLGPCSKINVVGTTGSGKTTAARLIAGQLGLKHIEIDALFWKPNWEETPDETFLPAVEEATRGDRWVLDGNYSRTRSIVWPRLDTVIWLDYSFLRIFWQLLRRTIHRSGSREPLWGGCQEEFRKSFLSRDSILIWFFKTYWRRRRNFPVLFRKPEYAHIQFLAFRTPRALHQWLNAVSNGWSYDLDV